MLWAAFLPSSSSSSFSTAWQEITFNCLVYAERANLILLRACVRERVSEVGWMSGCLCGAARTPFELRQNVTITHIDCWFLLLFAFFLKKPLFYAAVDFSNMRFIIRTHTHKNEKLEKSKKERARKIDTRSTLILLCSEVCVSVHYVVSIFFGSRSFSKWIRLLAQKVHVPIRHLMAHNYYSRLRCVCALFNR